MSAYCISEHISELVFLYKNIISWITGNSDDEQWTTNYRKQNHDPEKKSLFQSQNILKLTCAHNRFSSNIFLSI